MVKIELPRGMRDLDTDEYEKINYVKEKFFETAKLFSFKHMDPSPLELLSTLETKSGTSISNEIYSFADKAGRDVALRFDLTIGLTRYVASRRDLRLPVKLAAFAGVWRYDEPQAGRYRFFHQWDVEIYGSFSIDADAEIIEFVSIFFAKLGLDVIIDVNSRQLMEEFVTEELGVSDEKMILELFRAVDKVAKKGVESVLQEYKGKVDRNKLEALIKLSSNKGSISEVKSKVPRITSLKSWPALAELFESLKLRNVSNVRLNLGIIRGLDYYSGIVFEAFDSSTNGGALVGGGRYDSLTKAFGRADVGATGAAGGVERIIMSLEKHSAIKASLRQLVYIAVASQAVRGQALSLLGSLRSDGISAEYDIQARPLRKQLEDSAFKGASLTIIVAPEEIAASNVIVKNMRDGNETLVSTKDLQHFIVKSLSD